VVRLLGTTFVQTYIYFSRNRDAVLKALVRIDIAPVIRWWPCGIIDAIIDPWRVVAVMQVKPKLDSADPSEATLVVVHRVDSGDNIYFISL
jgi:hypothetical protein